MLNHGRRQCTRMKHQTVGRRAEADFARKVTTVLIDVFRFWKFNLHRRYQICAASQSGQQLIPAAQGHIDHKQVVIVIGADAVEGQLAAAIVLTETGGAAGVKTRQHFVLGQYLAGLTQIGGGQCQQTGFTEMTGLHVQTHFQTQCRGMTAADGIVPESHKARDTDAGIRG